MAQIDIERGDRAREVLVNPVYLEAYEAIEKELVDRWKRSESAEDRESLWMELRLLSKVQTWLATVMQSGLIERQRTLSQRAKDLVRAAANGLR